MTGPEELTTEIRRGIPLAEAMGLEVLRADPRHVILTAPAQPNHNVHGTAFAGSLASLLTLTTWVQARCILEEAALTASVVARKGDTDYLKPVIGPLTAESLPPDQEEVRRFTEELRRTGKSRITLQARILTDKGEPAVLFSAVIAAK